MQTILQGHIHVPSNIAVNRLDSLKEGTKGQMLTKGGHMPLVLPPGSATYEAL